MTLQADFKTRFPDLNATAIDTAWPVLEVVWPCYYAFEYGISACQSEAIFQLIAHLFVASSSTNNAPVKEVSGQSVGSISQTFSVAPIASDRSSFFNSTKYGQQFLILTAARQGAFWV